MTPFGDDRGMRNVVGFTLVFAVVLISVGVVATFGQDEVRAMSDSEQVDNAEEAMTLVADNFQQLQQQRASTRSNEMDLSGGSMAVGSGPSVTVGASGPSTSFEEAIPVGHLQYTYDKTSITYENGALFRSRDGGGTTLRSTPSMTCTEDRAVVTVVSLESSGTTQVGGQFVTVTGASESEELLFPKNRTGPDSVADVTDANVTVSSSRSDTWSEYFAEHDEWTAGSGNTYRCEDVEAVYIRHAVISVSFTA